MPDAEWWRNAVVYQIYPRSFADADGNGIGDLRGVTNRVGYLRDLGVDAVWLSPFYPSALADGGYDVDDYRDVDPQIGTLADFDELTAVLHEAGIRIIVDLVPNHTSDAHAWFTAAVAAGPGSAERDRYIFRDGLGADGAQPPNDWESAFGGSAWERVTDADGTPGQWYFHYFAREQPDLNWDDVSVRADFETTLRFWSDRGVDGFRVDVAHGLAKDLSDLSVPWSEVGEPGRPDGTHPLWDRDDVHDIYAAWRRVFNTYTPARFAVAEAQVHPSRRSRYASADGLGQAFNFELQEADWSAADYRYVISSGLTAMEQSGSTTTWLLGCHDVVRVATRFGLPTPQGDPAAGPHQALAMAVSQDWLRTDGVEPVLDRARGERRAQAAMLIMFALPGAAYLYQGDELGLPEVGDLPRSVLQDPIARRSGDARKGRDGCRVPLPWTATGPSYGFGSGAAHLPQPDYFADYAVEVEAADPGSTLTMVRTALALRRRTSADETLTWVDDGDPEVVHVMRSGDWHCVANFGPQPVRLPAGEVMISTVPLVDGLLPTDATAWVRTGQATS